MMANKMKQCKACGQTIAKSAKVCPSCGAKQGGKGKIIAIAVVAIVALLFIIGNSGNNKTSQINNAGASNSTNSSSSSSEGTSGSSANEPQDEYVVVGGSFEKDGFKFTVDEADLEYVLKNNDYGLYDLDEGLHYIAVTFTFENNSGSDKYVSIYDFDCYADDVKCEQEFVTADTGDFINANLSSGRKVSFMTLYAVPDGAENIELEYTTNIWSGEKILVKLQ